MAATTLFSIKVIASESCDLRASVSSLKLVMIRSWLFSLTGVDPMCVSVAPKYDAGRQMLKTGKVNP